MISRAIKPAVNSIVEMCNRVSRLVDRIQEQGITVKNTHALGRDVPDTVFRITIGEDEE